MAILSRKELPSWMKPSENDSVRFSVFENRADAHVSEFIFAMMKSGCVHLDEHRMHGEHVVRSWGVANWLSPEVMIAAGVEALRRVSKGPEDV